MTITAYTDLITSQHKTRPKFMSWLSAALTLVDDNVTAINGMPTSFDVDSATGLQLDTIGSIVGISRNLGFQPSDGATPILDDTNYRIALKARIAQNQWDGTLPAVYDLWSSLFPDITLTVVDNQDMTMNALVSGNLDPIITELVAAGYIIPKPAGVGLTIIETDPISGTVYLGVVFTENSYTSLTTN